MFPVHGYSVHPAYGATGPYWTSCGWHTGADIAAPAGTAVAAARGGVARHCDYGPAFGEHQFTIEPGDGTEDFYAHCQTRPKHGATVATGEYVAQVGDEGQASGPHLHFERHTDTGYWHCTIICDPAPSFAYTEPEPADDWDDMRVIWILEPSGIGGILTGDTFAGIGGGEAEQLRAEGWCEIHVNAATADTWKRSGIKGL